ncbi:hypothetical protein BO83DRAFT_318885 [Aspergillus eucalypticola CBS 122712]|uniref:Uncharacterized protein n=1 Tax=Aspergillus eucalypticola (strain CBS 122712 / IBT 29274) TaxID=1448314 RepID=A0A317V391_ASPEC|nr:uncharacterized protein BO83DRAFT_318885 [Aspergillus eucalypticola CBS 122712]PWY67317.1 hypothetical protein BO83DRAFT_318885 [Aspergillus eucalypticola CBS 122712]
MDKTSVQEASSPADTDRNSDRHVSEDESSPQIEDVEALKAEVAFLRDKLEILQGKASLDFKLQMQMLTAGAKGWPDYDFEVLGHRIRQVMYRIEHWCQQHARQGMPDTVELHDLKKQALIHSLEGYWVQDLEWDTLMKSLPYPFSLYMSEVLAQSILTKNIVDKFFVNPFWYLEGEGLDRQDHTTGSVSCAQNLQHLYRRFLESGNISSASFYHPHLMLTRTAANGIRATIWKKETTKEYRTNAVALFASTLLSDVFFQRLLKSVDCDEATKREDSLLELCKFADETAITLGSNQGHCVYKTLPTMGTTFDPRSHEATVHNLHNVRGNADDARLAGRRILGITQPAVILKLRTLRCDENVLNKAKLLVEHGDYTEEDHERERPKPSAKTPEEVETEEE